MKLIIKETTYWEIDVPHIDNKEELEEMAGEILSEGLNHSDMILLNNSQGVEAECKVTVFDHRGGMDYEAVNDLEEMTI